jgi:hypothetical protein
VVEFKHFRSVKLKIFNNSLSISVVLKNWSTLRIIASIFALILSSYYIESSTLSATIGVTGIFCAFNIYSLKKSVKNKTVSFHPYILDLKLPAPLMVISYISFYTASSLIFMNIASILQHAILKGNIELGYSEVIILFFAFYAFLFVMIMLYKKSKAMNYFTPDVQIAHLQSKYYLDLKETYFFISDGYITRFIVGNYTFDLIFGLRIGDRYYKLSLVLDYLKNMGIFLKDLNKGHLQIIEMYGIGAE